MRRLTEDDVAAAPVPPGPAAEEWKTHLTYAEQGVRATAQTAMSRFVDRLSDTGPDAQTRFAEWLCGLLFDESDFGAGQGGGDLTRTPTGRQAPWAPMLTVHPVTARVALPY